MLAVGTDRQFAALCEVIGAPELAADPRFTTNERRVESRGVLRIELEQRLRARPASYWTDELTEARVPAGVVNDVAGAFALAEALGLDPIVSIPRDDGSVARLTRNPIGLSDTPPTYRRAPPRLPG